MPKKVQVTVEYLLFIAALLLVLIFSVSSNQASLSRGTSNYMTNSAHQVVSLVNASIAASPALREKYVCRCASADWIIAEEDPNAPGSGCFGTNIPGGTAAANSRTFCVDSVNQCTRNACVEQFSMDYPAAIDCTLANADQCL